MPEESTTNSGPAPKADDNRVFDVARPGKTGPNPSSRPLIVGHRPLLTEDPMVKSADDNDVDKKDAEEPSGVPFQKTDDNAGEPPATDEKPAKSLFGTKKLKPLEVPGSVQEPSDESKEDPPKETEPEQAPQPETPDQAKEQPPASPIEGQQVGLDQLAAKKAEQEAAARHDELAKLAAAKTYALPISQKRSTRLLLASMVGLAIVLAAAIFIIVSKS